MATDDGHCVSIVHCGAIPRNILLDCQLQNVVFLRMRCTPVFAYMLAWNGMFNDLK